MMDRTERLRVKLNRKMLRTSKIYGLLEPYDRVMVAISGGKDSYTLLDLLWRARERVPFSFDLIAVHLDQRQPGYNGEKLASWLADYGAPYEILSEDTYSIVKELTAEGGTYCAPCSRLRRGVLYSAAERLGCNKIALGHHRDDTIETLLMNLFYSGRIQAMPAIYTTDDQRFQVIRPLIECGEVEIEEYAQLMQFPILPCNLCGSQEGLKRMETKRLLRQLEMENPRIRETLLASLKHVKPTHLLDQNLLQRVQETQEDLEEESTSLDQSLNNTLVQIEG